MFERYTEKARRVIFFARYEASQFGSPYIETEHLLLGLIREDKNISYKILSTGGHGNPQGHRRPHRSAASTSASTTARSAFGNCGNRRGRFAWCRILERARLDLHGMLWEVRCKQ